MKPFKHQTNYNIYSDKEAPDALDDDSPKPARLAVDAIKAFNNPFGLFQKPALFEILPTFSEEALSLSDEDDPNILLRDQISDEPDDEYDEDFYSDYEDNDFPEFSGYAFFYSFFRIPEAAVAFVLSASVHNALKAKASASGLNPAQYAVKILNAIPLAKNADPKENPSGNNYLRYEDASLQPVSDNEKVLVYHFPERLIARIEANALVQGVSVPAYIENALTATYLGKKAEDVIAERVQKLHLDEFFLECLPYARGDARFELAMPLVLRDAIAEKMALNPELYYTDEALPPFMLYARTLLSNYFSDFEIAALSAQAPENFEDSDFYFRSNWPTDGVAFVNFMLPSYVTAALYVAAQREGASLAQFIIDILVEDIFLDPPSNCDVERLQAICETFGNNYQFSDNRLN